LETHWKQSSNTLSNEKLVLQNTQALLSAANQRIKEKELVEKDLHNAIDTLTHHSDDSKAHIAKIEREKSIAENRVRELEANLRAATQTSSIPVTRAHGRNVRPRSSSVSLSLQRDSNDARAMLSKKEAELQLAQDKVGRLQTQCIKLENEKTALEKKMQNDRHQLQTQLEEKDYELDYLRAQRSGESCGASEREEDLLRRIEEDDAKIAVLLRDREEIDDSKEALKKVEHQLQIEVAKAWRSSRAAA